MSLFPIRYLFRGVGLPMTEQDVVSEEIFILGAYRDTPGVTQMIQSTLVYDAASLAYACTSRAGIPASCKWNVLLMLRKKYHGVHSTQPNLM